MKKLVFLVFVLFIFNKTFAQKECEFASNFTDSIGSYKSTKDYLIHEKVFGNKKSAIYLSLVNADGLLSLQLQQIISSADFFKANCFNSKSKIYFQLLNGKIVTLFYLGEENCGTSLRKENLNYRILTSNFVFSKENYNELKNSPVSLMRITFSGETEDYIINDELNSEIDKGVYFPSTYFMNFLKCIE